MTPLSAMESPTMAFGVDPTRRERYSLRQARYQAIAEDVGALGKEFQERGERLQVLDVGTWDGVLMRYMEPQDPGRKIDLHGVDLKFQEFMYHREAWKSLREGNLLDGLKFLPSNTFDVVICEQVLEHLPDVNGPLETLTRVLKPGGLLIVGVPIFPSGIHLIRRHLVPRFDKWFGVTKVRGHIQAFSRASFLRNIQESCDVDIESTRGFRVISGGVLRPLENAHWWWKFNCAMGRTVPGLCVEIQVLARKRGEAQTALPAAA